MAVEALCHIYNRTRRLAVRHLVNEGGHADVDCEAVIRAVIGGYLPFYSARTDHAFRHRPEMRKHIDRLPSEYLANIWFDSTVFAPDLLERLVRTYGADRVLMGTDYPFDMGQGNPIDFVRSAGLSDAEHAMILGENANRLFGFGLGQ